jgi:hypothetical protein
MARATCSRSGLAERDRARCSPCPLMLADQVCSSREHPAFAISVLERELPWLLADLWATGPGGLANPRPAFTTEVPNVAGLPVDLEVNAPCSIAPGRPRDAAVTRGRVIMCDGIFSAWIALINCIPVSLGMRRLPRGRCTARGPGNIRGDRTSGGRTDFDPSLSCSSRFLWVSLERLRQDQDVDWPGSRVVLRLGSRPPMYLRGIGAE